MSVPRGAAEHHSQSNGCSSGKVSSGNIGLIRAEGVSLSPARATDVPCGASPSAPRHARRPRPPATTPVPALGATSRRRHPRPRAPPPPPRAPHSPPATQSHLRVAIVIIVVVTVVIIVVVEVDAVLEYD
jgi:hypothetical protein